MPMSMETIIENAKQHGYAPVRYPTTRELLRRRCPECWTPGAMVIFRHQDESLVDIYACECGYRRYGG